LYALDLEFGCGASSTWGNAGPVAFMKMENWGTAAHFSANAFLFHLAGETSASGNLLYNDGLRVRIGTTSKYIPLSTTEGTITRGSDGTAGGDLKIFGDASGTYLLWDCDGLKQDTSGGSGLLYIKKTFTPPGTGYEDTVRINSYPTMVSGATTRGLQVLSECLAGSAGSYMVGITGIAEQGSTAAITGVMAAGCFSLINSAHSGCLKTCVEMTWKNTGSADYSKSAYMLLREYSGAGGDKVKQLFSFPDHTTEMAAESDTAIVSTLTEGDSTHGIKIVVGTTPYWIMCTSTAPTSAA